MKSRKNVSSCSGFFTSSPFCGLVEERIRPPCSASARQVVKKKVTASMWAGL